MPTSPSTPKSKSVAILGPNPKLPKTRGGAVDWASVLAVYPSLKPTEAAQIQASLDSKAPRVPNRPPFMGPGPKQNK